MSDNFFDPFCPTLDKEHLYNIAPGQPLSEEATECLLSAEKSGEVRMMEFDQRYEKDGSKENLFDLLKRVPWNGFANSRKKTEVKVGVKCKDKNVQRNILGLLLAKSSQENPIINIDRALSYPLCPVPFALATRANTLKVKDKSKYPQDKIILRPVISTFHTYSFHVYS